MINDEMIARTTSVLVYHSDDIYIKYLLDNIDFLERTADTILRELEMVDFPEYIYDMYMPLETTLSLTQEFLSTINEEYPKRFETLIQNGSFNLYDGSDKENRRLYGLQAYHESYEENNEERVNINVPIGHTIDDLYTIIHEFIHNTNMSESVDRSIYTETSSILYEYLLYRFLKEKDVNQQDNKYSLLYRVKDLRRKANFISTYCKFVKETRKEYKLNTDEETLEEDYHSVSSDIKYYLGELISVLKYHDLVRGIIDIKHINNFNEGITKNDDNESLNYLFIKEPTDEEITSSLTCILEELMKNNSKTNK